MAKFSLLTTLTLNAVGFNKGVDKAKANTRAFAQGVENANKSIKGSFGQLQQLTGNVGGQFGVLASSVGSGVKAFKAMVPAINSFKTALISTGIGALIVGLGTAVAALTSYFKNTEEGQIAFKKVMNGVKAVIEPVLALVSKLGKAMFLLLKGDFKEAWQTVKEGFSQVGDQIKDNIDNLADLNKAEQDLLITQRENLLKNKKLQAEISDLRNKAKDTEKYSSQERLSFANKAIEKQKEYSANLQKEADLELKVATMKASFGDNDIATNNELNELKAKQYDIQKEEADKLREIYETQRSISKEAKIEAIERIRSLEALYQSKAATNIKGKKASIDVTANVDNTQLSNMDAFMKKNTDNAEIYNKQLEKSEKLWYRLGDSIQNTNFIADAFGGAVNGISNALGNLFMNSKSGFKDMVTSMLDGLRQIINGLLAQAIAGLFSKELSSKGILGFATAGIGLSILMGLWKSKVPEFATGGIVGGTSFSGDNILAKVNSGEMILNQAQQSKLFSLANGSGAYGGEVRFEIAGDKLIGVLNNYDRKINRFK